MHIPSIKTRRDMETAAELRAAGATWDTIAERLQRQPAVLIRWTKTYRDDWERFLADAEDRISRQASNESRSVMRTLLRHKSSKIRLTAAEKLAKQRLAEKAALPPPEPRADMTAFLTYAQEISDEQLDEYIAEFIQQRQK